MKNPHPSGLPPDDEPPEMSDAEADLEAEHALGKPLEYPSAVDGVKAMTDRITFLEAEIGTLRAAMKRWKRKPAGILESVARFEADLVTARERLADYQRQVQANN